MMNFEASDRTFDDGVDLAFYSASDRTFDDGVM
jgi:hypothetical protein